MFPAIPSTSPPIDGKYCGCGASGSAFSSAAAMLSIVSSDHRRPISDTPRGSTPRHVPHGSVIIGAPATAARDDARPPVKSSFGSIGQPGPPLGARSTSQSLSSKVLYDSQPKNALLKNEARLASVSHFCTRYRMCFLFTCATSKPLAAV